MRGLGRAVVEIAIMGSVAATAYFCFPHQVRTLLSQTYENYWPCTAPLTYRIGTIDPRFNLSTSSVESLLAQAAGKWNTAAKKEVLAEDPRNGIVVVDFVYDARQQTATTMNTIGSSVSDERSSYDTLVAEYNDKKDAFASQKEQYDTAKSSFDARVQAYQQTVASWNERGGAPDDTYAQLQSQKTQLDADQTALNAQVTALNASAAEINSLASQINGLIDSLNLKIAKYNEVGATNGGQFEEGLFTSKPGLETIDIYEYSTDTQLHRVLAHEFGHALGLNHVDDSNAIMYKLNESSNENLTAADLQELDRACKL